jgi:S-adenosylmethionine:tRNA ribosyltransferase-isomerase
MALFTSDFTYDLPEARIALFPATQRDQSKLLVYDQGLISHRSFRDIVELIPSKTLLVFNNSKVIPARLRFKNETGATIEVFLLNPADRNVGAHEMLQRSSPVQWLCTIGNKKKWKLGVVLRQSGNGIDLQASLLDPEAGFVEFQFSGAQTWAEVIHHFGDTPLPPYIKRATETTDVERYQTVYSHTPGAVAAPTAGLHFTPEIIEKVVKNGVFADYLTLHVGAGTFMPIKADVATEHHMHEESIYFSETNICNLIEHHARIISVGTTSCRSLESLYWFGVKLMEDDQASFEIDQHFAYHERATLPSRKESLEKIRDVMQSKKLKALSGRTSIYIYPGYSFKMIDGLITNFHQPNSTLLLLIAAFIGDDWRKVYDSALANGYRFLSYGDSSLLIPKKS